MIKFPHNHQDIYSGRNKQKLVMPWLLASPSHQHPWYWLCRINGSLPSKSPNFTDIFLFCSISRPRDDTSSACIGLRWAPCPPPIHHRIPATCCPPPPVPPPLAEALLDCYTVLVWWQYDKACQWGMRHGLQLAGITRLWLVGLNM